MNKNRIISQLITAIADAYQGVAGLKVFASWPDDIVRCPLRPMYRPCGDVLKAGPALATGPRCSVEQAIRNAADSVHWLEPYAATAIGQGFADTFGCYAILRDAAPFQSSKLRIWMTDMPPNLCYPWHHHPAEEMFFVVSDTAVFSMTAVMIRLCKKATLCSTAETSAMPCITTIRRGYVCRSGGMNLTPRQFYCLRYPACCLFPTD